MQQFEPFFRCPPQFGVEYALEDDDASPLRTFAVPKDALRGLCRREGLEPLPQARAPAGSRGS